MLISVPQIGANLELRRSRFSYIEIEGKLLDGNFLYLTVHVNFWSLQILGEEPSHTLYAKHGRFLKLKNDYRDLKAEAWAIVEFCLEEYNALKVACP